MKKKSDKKKLHEKKIQAANKQLAALEKSLLIKPSNLDFIAKVPASKNTDFFFVDSEDGMEPRINNDNAIDDCYTNQKDAEKALQELGKGCIWFISKKKRAETILKDV